MKTGVTAPFRKVLRNVYFFNELSDHDLTRLETVCHEQHWDAGR